MNIFNTSNIYNYFILYIPYIRFVQNMKRSKSYVFDDTYNIRNTTNNTSDKVDIDDINSRYNYEYGKFLRSNRSMTSLRQLHPVNNDKHTLNDTKGLTSSVSSLTSNVSSCIDGTEFYEYTESQVPCDTCIEIYRKTMIFADERCDFSTIRKCDACTRTACYYSSYAIKDDGTVYRICSICKKEMDTTNDII